MLTTFPFTPKPCSPPPPPFRGPIPWGGEHCLVRSLCKYSGLSKQKDERRRLRVLFFSFSLFPLVNVIAWVRGQFKINFVCIFGVFPKLPESRCDEGNFGKTLKLQVNDNCTILKAGDRCHPFWVFISTCVTIKDV